MVTLEELHQVVVQGLASVNAKIDSTVAASEARLGSRIDSTVVAAEARLNAKFDARIDALEAKIDQEFAFVKRAITDHTQELKVIRATLDKKVDRDELEARH